MDRYTVADNICKFCNEKHISVDALAETIGKSARQVNRYRNGQCKSMSLDTLSDIADALHVSVADLLSSSNPH